jgi:SAM-dependent methyltransferase
MGETAGTEGRETPAEVFDRLFLPAMAGPWADRVARAARLGPGDRVLDVACGTGAVAAEALARVGPDGAVSGLDASPDMLSVARRKLPDLDLREGLAEDLPFADETFDVVTCQFGLMFFEDRRQALREMLRVMHPGGRLVVAVWDTLEHSAGYAALAELVERHLGADAGAPVRAAFALGDVGQLCSLLLEAGATSVEAGSVEATARFPSVHDWVHAEVRGWIGGEFGEAEYAALVQDAEVVLAPYVQADGTVEFLLPAIVATGSRS